MKEDLESSQEEKQKHWNTLIASRDMIQKLKSELQKAFDRIKILEQEAESDEAVWEEKLTEMEQTHKNECHQLKIDL